MQALILACDTKVCGVFEKTQLYFREPQESNVLRESRSQVR